MSTKTKVQPAAVSRPESLTRRGFLKSSALAGAGLCLIASETEVFAWQADSAGFRPSAYLEIKPDNQITFWVTRCEMGQGVRTLLPVLIAEELEVDPRSVKLIQPATTPEFRRIRLRTSGSGSAAGTWMPLRRAGAAARQMLIAAAAARWQVDAKDCRAELGAVIHPPTERKVTFGEVAAEASKMAVPADKDLVLRSKDFRLIGGKHKRVDSHDIVTGRAQYGFDVRVPGMKYAVMMRSPVLGGGIRRWSATEAMKLPGVRDVLPVSAGFAAGLAVTADTTWTALQASRLLKIEWEPGAWRNFSSDEHGAKLRAGLQDEGYVVRDERSGPALTDKLTTLEAAYEWPFQVHAPLETMNCTAQVKDGKCEIWVPTQAPEEIQQKVAEQLGIERDNVRVNVMMMGGGFGRRLKVDYALEAAELAQQVSYPVQLIWTRSDDMKFGHFNPASFSRFVARLDAKKRPVELLFRSASSDLSTYGPHSAASGKVYAADGNPWGAYDQPYRFSALRVEYFAVESPVPTGPWRAVAYPGTVFGRECFLDELAFNAGIDPIALRLELLMPGDVLKLEGSGEIDRRRLIRVLEQTRELAGWSKPLTAPAGRRLGRGLACNVYHAGTHMAMVAEVSVGKAGDVKVERIVSVVDLGQPLNVLGIEGQVESAVIWALSSTLKSEMRFANGQAVSSNYRDYPVLRMNETPRIETHILPSDLRPFGLGEQPVPLVAPAVANAIFNATRKRIRRLPILPANLA
jgi:isoquinoline 1-oxidoreductase subunit beta